MDPIKVLALNEALEGLERQDPDAATIVKMRTFAGMNCDEIAALLNTSRRTIERRWRYAMAELRVRLADPPTNHELPRRPTEGATDSPEPGT